MAESIALLAISGVGLRWKRYLDLPPWINFASGRSQRFTHRRLGLLRQFRAGQHGGTVGKEDKSVSGTRSSEPEQPARRSKSASETRRAPARGGGSVSKDRWQMDFRSDRLWCRDKARRYFGRQDPQLGRWRGGQYRRDHARPFQRLWKIQRRGRSSLRRHGFWNLHSHRWLHGPLDSDQAVETGASFQPAAPSNSQRDTFFTELEPALFFAKQTGGQS